MSVKNSSAEDYMGREFVILREFGAPCELVFNAWIHPRILVQWWGPKGFTNPVCKVDARPGGAIYIVMRGPNGVDYPMGGEFREIVAPHRLVLTTNALDENNNPLFELLHTVTIIERSGKSTLTIHSRVIKTTADAGRYLSGYEAGMTQSLGRLAEKVEGKDAAAVQS